MWQKFYRQRLRRDLQSWVSRGWISDSAAQQIVSSWEEDAGASRLPTILGVLGALLLGLAALTFVASNWADMPKLLRLTILLTAMWGAYVIAIWQHIGRHFWFTEGALLLGVLLFGANIMLIGQMYHLPADFPSGILLWTVGALTIAWAARSKAALALSFVLAALWVYVDSDADRFGFGLTFWPLWGAATLLALRLNWRPASHLMLLSALVWAVVHGVNFAELIDLDDVSGLLTALFLGLAIWTFGLGLPRSARFADPTLSHYGLVITIFFMFLLQIVDEPELFHRPALLVVCGTAVLAGLGLIAARSRLASADWLGFGSIYLAAGLFPLLLLRAENLIPWVYGAYMLFFAAWLVGHGGRLGSRFALNLGLTAFGAEALYVYFATLGSLLETATFFALGGVLLIAGSMLLLRWRRAAVTSPAATGVAQ